MAVRTPVVSSLGAAVTTMSHPWSFHTSSTGAAALLATASPLMPKSARPACVAFEMVGVTVTSASAGRFTEYSNVALVNAGASVTSVLPFFTTSPLRTGWRTTWTT